MLQKWKRTAEESSFRAIVALAVQSNPKTTEDAPDTADQEFIQRLNLPADDLDSVTRRLIAAAREDVAAFKRMPIWPPHAIALSLTMYDGEKARSFDVSGLAAALEAFNEIVVVAPPGTGKTTTLLQTIEALLGRGKLVPVFVALGEWSSQQDTLFHSITRRHAFLGTTEEHLKLLAHFGRLVLVMDGWNELDASSRKRANAEIKSLQREYPDLKVVVSTRRQALDVGISGPVVEIAALTEIQQLEIARALRNSQGESILDHAWRTSGIRELVAVPLYLTSLVAYSPGESLPTTKEEVLRIFVSEHERAAEKAEVLREVLFGFHSEMLRAIAVAATRAANTSISDTVARAVVKGVEENLAAMGQMTSLPQPTSVLDVLVSHHMLVRAGGTSGGVSFQHQQFQEWYASFEIEILMQQAASGDKTSRQQLRADLNGYAWEESILFACERLSRAGDGGEQAVGASIVETLAIDPMLAAEMIYRSAPAVWDRIQDTVIDFARRWHTPGTVDRAMRFMITTGRPEFALQIWPLVSNTDSQIYLAALRAGRRFRPSVLGPDRQTRIGLLPEEHRAAVLSEIAHWSGIEGIDLAAKLAQVDTSSVVRSAVVEALLFRRADRAVAEILRTSPDEVWSQLARKGYAGEVADPVGAERLRREHTQLIEGEQNPLSKLRALLDAARDGRDVSQKVLTLIEGADFPASDQHGAGAVYEAQKIYPSEVVAALTHRVETGLEIPFRAEELLQAAEIVVDQGPLVDLVLGDDASKKVTRAASAVAGPETLGRLIDLLIPIHAEVTNPDQVSNEVARQRHRELSERIANASLPSLAKALLARSRTDTPAEIGLFADILSRHGDPHEQPLLPLPTPLYEDVVAAVSAWGERLIASTTSSRSQLALVATVMGRLAAPEFVGVLQRMLAEDLARWRRSRDEFLAGLKNGVRVHSDAQMSWTLQYRRAFAAIGDDAVVKLMRAYLPDRGYCSFGVDAAHVLKEIWERRQNPSKDKRFISQPDFSEVGTRRTERQSQGAARADPTSFANEILAVVDALTAQGSDDEARAHAVRLASIAFGMPYSDRRSTIDTLLSLPQPLREKQKFLTVLVLAGEVIQSEMVLNCIKALQEESKTKPWLLNDQNWWEWEQWLMLIPFTDHPAATMDALGLLGPNVPEPWRLRGLLSALGYAPSTDAVEVLKTLAQKDPRFLDDHDWQRALERRGAALLARTLFEAISSGTYSLKPGGPDNWTLSRKLAAGMVVDPTFRAKIYHEYERDPAGAQGTLFEQGIAEVADKDGVLILVRGHARANKTFSGALHSAIRHVAEGQRPSASWAGTVEMFSCAVPELRKQLFAITNGGSAEARLAAECLTAIDQIRDEYGPAESEPRHPDIDSGRPWPALAPLDKTL
jgi:hypothetical protein